MLPSWHENALNYRIQGIGAISSMADGTFSFGLCADVAEAIAYSVVGADNTEMISLSPLDKQASEWNFHAAIFDISSEMIVDYTIRQFDSTLPFPFVGTIEDWQTTIETVLGEQWELDQ